MTAPPARGDKAAPPALFDCSAFASFNNWRSMAWWPISVEETRQFQQAWVKTVVDFIFDQNEPDLTDTLLLGFAGIATRTLPMAEAAIALQRADEIGTTMVGGPPEVSWLAGASDQSSPPIASTPHVQALVASRRPLAKRLVLTARWNSVSNVPRALLWPDATVMATNQFLSDEAKSSPRILSYRDAGAFVHAARRAGQPAVDPQTVENLARHIVAALLSVTPVTGRFGERLQAMMTAKVIATLRICADDIAAIRRAPTLPPEIWGGSGNAYALRVIALESLRRGGRVKLFDHGGAAAMVPAIDAFAVRELAVCTEYVMPSPGIADLHEMRACSARVSTLRQSQVTGGRGEKHLLQLPLRRNRKISDRPCVIYVSAVLRGFHRTGQVALPDSLYLEWQLRVAEALRKLPVDLVCKPHPEGVFRGRSHPLEDVARTTYVRFEETIAHADVFVFDRCVSTTFWEAVCTDRRIVYLDMGFLTFARAVAPMVDRRCRRVPVTYDQMNRPQFDHDTLRDAVLGGGEAGDPTEFQQLFINEQA